ncbi:uncharacterized protein CcaverHIS019_0405550 [Cutaneotrichosporon cavernicola]|uniref:Protein kinase domain-containing protein n=1 Tax=Cutaneotrichosporon cavernicola TaxID=279322 RepID=A0AA48L4E4_9TREE|nr:uncharacterized protein CcaverHIS019_0405550 [Cutaneotrichosporon cavernicola]BEI91735.1 hypothetical protein CcaverHIS019_0405550 [Cutaneotrichosporon cavernicola]
MATPSMINPRTRSRWYMESPIRRAASPFKPKGGIHHAPKRRRIGMSSLNVNRLLPSSDTDSNRDLYPLRNRLFLPSPRATPRVNKRSGAPRRPRPPPLFEGEDTMSPRKRKRSDAESMSDKSWIETEDEMPEFIAQDDQHLLQLAPASALHRLRKNELIRLWKVCGMWPSDDEDEDIGEQQTKVDLVNGLIKARKKVGAPESPSLGHSPSDVPRTPRDSGSSSLTSPPSSSGDSQLIKYIKMEATPKAPARGNNRHLQQLSTANREQQGTPTIRRLRPRTRRNAGSDDESVPAGSSRQLCQSDLTVTRETRDRRAKREAMRVMQAEDTNSSDENASDTGRAFGDIQDRSESSNDVDDDSMDDDGSDEPEGWGADASLEGVTHASLMRLRRDQLVQLCEQRNLEVGGTKPQLATALITWQDERLDNLESVSTTSSQDTARPSSPTIMPAVLTHCHRGVEDTPLLQRNRIHAENPATPHPSDRDKPRTPDNDLNLDLQELGLEDFTIKPEFLQKMEKIGSGGFKDVYVGKLRGRRVAISEFREHLSDMDIRELKLLAEFRHPNIVRFRGICIPEDTSQVPCMLISELCENGDLFDYIRNVSNPSLKRVLRLMLDIARGLEYLHLRNPAVIHRDCKSTNILINKQGVAKVGDFGLARVKQSTRSMIRSLVGTVNWQAPELWHPHPKYDYKVDVFSLALVYWEMLSGWTGEPKYPWEGYNEHYIYDAVGQKHRRLPLTGLRKHWGVEPVNLIERMWHQDPAERPTMSDVVADVEALLADCQ